MENKDTLLYELVSQILEEQKQQNKNLTKIEVSFAKMESNVDQNTEDLAYHIQRTNVLENLHKDNQNRIEKLEMPMSAKDLIKITSMTFGALTAIGSAIVGALRFFHIF